MNTGLALSLIFEFVFSLYFVFLKFWVRIFLFFVFLKLLIRIFFVFCIFEQLRSYFFCICLVFFSYCFCKNTKKYEKNTNKIQKNTLCIFVFLVFFHYVQKMQFVFLYFFFVFFQSSQIALCPFVFFAFFRHAVKEQNRESINVCCIFLLLIILPCSVLYFFGNWSCIFCFFVFLMITGFTVCSRLGTTQV